MNEKIIISSLAMDLKRVALGLYHKSPSAEVFKKEAFKRGEELENFVKDTKAQKLWQKTKVVLKSNSDRTAEDALMYSTLFQNFVTKNWS